MKIRHVQRSDRAEWLRLLLGLYPDTAEPDHTAGIDAFLDGTPLEELLPVAVLVSERDDGTLSGVLELSVRPYAEGCSGATPYVESWYVDADVRATGIGRALMTAAGQWARQNGFDEMASDALLTNDLSHRAHRALGFEEVERSVHFRRDLRGT